MKRSAGGVVRAVGMAACLAVSAGAHAAADEVPASVQPRPVDTDNPDLDAIRRFVEVYRLVKAAYVEPVSDQDLIESAIHGMLSGLDPHSGYLDLDSLEVLTDDTLGAYDGLGVEVLSGEGVIQVMAAMPDSPAAKAGLKAGDYITHVDGTAVGRANLDDAVRKLRGRPGTRIRLTVSREGDEAPRQVELTRARIRLSSVEAQLLEPGYGYVRVSQCQQETPAELRRRLAQLDREAGGLRGLVLDLRGNPGGALDAAVAITDLFVAEGRIVSIDGRVDDFRASYDARPGDPWESLALAVLIDDGTASAAEIIAAALKVHDRAVLLGRRSYGKGSVQNVFGLDTEHAVRLTTARYFTADGRSIQAEGVRPDIVLGDYRLEGADASTAPVLVERDLPGHLSAGEIVPETAVVVDDAAIGHDDYAVHQAMLVLKSQAVLARRSTPAASDAARR